MVNQYTATPIPTKNLLSVLYYICGLTQTEIGQTCGVSQKIVWNWFKKLGIESRIAKKRNQFGKNNDSWKENPGIAALHIRLKSIKGTANRCEVCGKGKHFEWANLTEKYEDINDYKMMCKSCHAKYDNKARNFKVGDAK